MIGGLPLPPNHLITGAKYWLFPEGKNIRRKKASCITDSLANWNTKGAINDSI